MKKLKGVQPRYTRISAEPPDREYKKGWIVDAYWEVYNKCNSANQAVLTGVSGW